MRALVGIPTLTRADLLVRNKGFLEGLRPDDDALIIDNGRQEIGIQVPVERQWKNLGVGGSWNLLLRRAFLGTHKFDLLVILQDDIIWDAARLTAAKRIMAAHPDVDLALSPFQFAVQVHRPANIETIGFYDERYYPAWCEDDDYAMTMDQRGRVYQRFVELDPLPGSLANGTDKAVPWHHQKAKLTAKWGRDLAINDPGAPHFWTNRGVRI